MGADRIASMFAAARREARTAFLPFMTAGLPTPAGSPGIFVAMAEAGADGFEVGIPYSDPLMDGPVIQRGSDTAIAAGTSLDVALGIVAEVTDRVQRPVLAMTYANPVFRRGVDTFAERLAAAGADGVIVPDLPVEESAPLAHAVHRHGLGLVQFVAPTSDDHRIRAVADADPAFIYAVAEMGVTGERTESGGHAARLIEQIRRHTEAPVVFGVGISTPEQARTVADAGADGVIVGSALVRRVLDSPDPESAAASAADLVHEVAAALLPPTGEEGQRPS